MNAFEKPRYLFPKPYADLVQRLRVAAGFALLIAFALCSRPSADSIRISLPVAILGLWLRAWAAGHLAKNQQLATTGPYSYVRNPLYSGTLIAAAGIVIASRSVVLFVVFAIVFLFVYLPVIELEEQHLRDMFPVYEPYAARVHRFIPLARWRGERQPFSWQLYARNEEYKALIGFLVALAWLGFRCWWTRG